MKTNLYQIKLVHVAISTVYYLYLNTKAHKYVHCLIEYSFYILTKRYIIESYENSMEWLFQTMLNHIKYKIQ